MSQSVAQKSPIKPLKPKNAITITYTCPKCKHSFKDKMDLGYQRRKSQTRTSKKTVLHFCLARTKNSAIKLVKLSGQGFMRKWLSLGKEMKERDDRQQAHL
jgi:hypothetical protein